MRPLEQETPVPHFHPLTPDRWDDLVALFEHHGNPGYCWCMTWRITSAQYKQLNSTGRKQALESLVKAGTPTGILAYRHGEPVGWCSVAPRETYARLERSSTLKRIDDLPTWSVVCFFVKREVRGRGLSLLLLRSAVAYAVSQGAEIVEGYPVESNQSYRFMGSPSTFEQAGFRDAAIAANGRRIMRYVVGTRAPNQG
jgi:GNAT superfamily N-acetyltransferase